MANEEFETRSGKPLDAPWENVESYILQICLFV
jgi:hypothetical protein